jgi:hypothetical protein
MQSDHQGLQEETTNLILKSYKSTIQYWFFHIMAPDRHHKCLDCTGAPWLIVVFMIPCHLPCQPRKKKLSNATSRIDIVGVKSSNPLVGCCLFLPPLPYHLLEYNDDLISWSYPPYYISSDISHSQPCNDQMVTQFPMWDAPILGELLLRRGYYQPYVNLHTVSKGWLGLGLTGEFWWKPYYSHGMKSLSMAPKIGAIDTISSVKFWLLHSLHQPS